MRSSPACLLLLCGLGGAAAAQRVPVPLQDQCAALPAGSLKQRAQAAPRRTLTSPFRVWPGGDTMTVTLAFADTATAYCARFLEGDVSVPVVTALPGTGQQTGITSVTLALPAIRFGWLEDRNLILIALPLDSVGRLVPDKPQVAAIQPVRLSNRMFATLGAITVALLGYFFAVFALGKIGTRHSFNPVYLTANTFGKASLSQLQIFGFTLLVLGLLVYVLLRTGLLSDISEDILLLLGISAAGTAGSKVAGIMKRRLSFDSWAWLQNQGWLVTYEVGTGKDADAKRARWADLLKTGGTFDVYSFQLATVSLLVGGALLGSVGDLATFTIPNNLLALLGLSNVVYIGGKAVDPDSYGELDQKVKAMREAEQSWLEAAAPQVAAAAGAAAKFTAAKAQDPAKYQLYLVKAREAARMLKSLYGTEGTKFKQEPIGEAELAPSFT